MFEWYNEIKTGCVEESAKEKEDQQQVCLVFRPVFHRRCGGRGWCSRPSCRNRDLNRETLLRSGEYPGISLSVLGAPAHPLVKNL